MSTISIIKMNIYCIPANSTHDFIQWDIYSSMIFYFKIIFINFMTLQLTTIILQYSDIYPYKISLYYLFVTFFIFNSYKIIIFNFVNN